MYNPRYRRRPTHPGRKTYYGPSPTQNPAGFILMIPVNIVVTIALLALAAVAFALWGSATIALGAVVAAEKTGAAAHRIFRKREKP